MDKIITINNEIDDIQDLIIETQALHDKLKHKTDIELKIQPLRELMLKKIEERESLMGNVGDDW